MAFPSTLETLNTSRADNTLMATTHPADHNNVNRIVNALQVKSGVDGSAVNTTFDFKLGEISGGDKALGKSASQTITNKTIAGGSNTISGITEAMLSTSDVTTLDVTTSKHGFTPKAPNDTTKFLRGDATWAAPGGTPAGTVAIFSASSAPTGWLLCDGSAVSRTTYADLFAVVSTTFGSGDGSTTFNVPNLKGKVVVGIDSGQTEFDTLAETGGSKTHTLTAAQLPDVTISVARSGNNIAGSGQYIVMSTADGGETVDAASATGLKSANGDAHNNLQPYMALHYIIKI